MSVYDSFRAWLADQGRSRQTIRAYTSDLKHFADWFNQTNGQALTPNNLTAIDAREYKQWLLQQKAAPATINRRLIALRIFADFAISQGHISTNPLTNIKPIKQQALRPRWLEKTQQAALLRESEKSINAASAGDRRARATRDHAIVVFLLHTGLRVAELCALVRSDVQIGKRSGAVNVRDGKGGKARRVPVNAAARDALRAWVLIPSQSDSMFGVQPRQVEKLIAELGRRAGVAVTPHTLRHTFARNMRNTLIAHKGRHVTLEELAALLGHEKISTTVRYELPGEADLQQAVEAME